MPLAFESQSIDCKLAELRSEFDAQVERPQGGDRLIGLFYAGLREVFEPEGIDSIYAKAFDARPKLGAVHASGLARAAIQKQALRRQGQDTNFPVGFESSENYSDLIRRVMRNPASRKEFQRDILTRNVQTNVADRGKGPKLLAMFYAERFGDRPLRILDVGCGQNHLLKKLVLTELPSVYYSPVTVEKPTNAGSHISAEDPWLSRSFNTKLGAGGLALGKCVGIDKKSNKRKKDIEWIRSSFYLSELLNPAILEEFDLIETSRPAHTSFRKVDILDMAESENPGDKLESFAPDIAICSATLYQLSPEQRKLARSAIRACLPPDGIAMYLDFASVNSKDPSKLEFFKHWDPYTFRLLVEDMREPDNLQEIIKWQNGRCSQAKLGEGRLIIGNKPQTLESLLRQPVL